MVNSTPQQRRRLRRRRVAHGAFLVTAVLLLASCRLLFDVGDLGGSPTMADGGNGGDGGDASSLPLNCSAITSRGLCACSKHDFCEDFENGLLGAQWSGVPGTANPLTRSTASLSFTDAAFQGAQAMLSTAKEDNSSAVVFLTHQANQRASRPSGVAFGAIRYRSYVEVAALNIVEIRGPLPDAGSAVIAALATINVSTLAIGGVAVLVSAEGVYLFGSNDLLEPRRRDANIDDVLIKIEDAQPQDLSRWASVELLVGYRSVIKKAGFLSSCGAGGDTDLVIAAGFGPANIKQACALMPPSLGGATWAETPIIAAGVALYGGGSIAVHQDSVAVDFLDP